MKTTLRIGDTLIHNNNAFKIKELHNSFAIVRNNHRIYYEDMEPTPISYDVFVLLGFYPLGQLWEHDDFPFSVTDDGDIYLYSHRVHAVQYAHELSSIMSNFRI